MYRKILTFILNNKINKLNIFIFNKNIKELIKLYYEYILICILIILLYS